MIVSGTLAGGGESAAYTLTFSPDSAGRLRFVAKVEEPYNRVYLTYASRPEEHFFGFGTQYTRLDMKGKKVPVFIGEQGIGRGAQPITLAANLRAGAGGEWYTSYASVPHYITSTSRSLFLENHEYSTFDLRDSERVQAEVFSGRMEGQILSGDSPAKLIEQYTEYSGRMRPPPDWPHLRRRGRDAGRHGQGSEAAPAAEKARHPGGRVLVTGLGRPEAD